MPVVFYIYLVYFAPRRLQCDAEFYKDKEKELLEKCKQLDKDISRYFPGGKVKLKLDEKQKKEL